VESEIVQSGDTTQQVIHCYGHGGAGITLAMGCAEDAVKLLDVDRSI
jgi:D-amino-acid oxidase